MMRSRSYKHIARRNATIVNTICLLLAVLIAASIVAPMTTRKAIAADKYETGTYVTGSRMKLREEPSKSSSCIGKVAKGTRIQVTDVENTVWGKVTISGKTGYVHLGYCKKNGSSTPTPRTDASGKTFKVLNSVYVRTEPSTATGEIIGCLSKGKTVEVQKMTGGWAVIECKGQTGYVYGEYLQAAGSGSSSDSSAPRKRGSYTTGTYKVSTKALRIRAAANADAEILGKVKMGTKVKVTEVKRCWGKVTVNGKTGYICLDYCEK